MKQTREQVLCQTWVRYFDEHGEGLACPDIIIPELRLLIECKRTYTPAADAQLLYVYKPLVDRLWPADWRCVAASRFWAGEPKKLIDSPFQAQVGINYYLHR